MTWWQEAQKAKVTLHYTVSMRLHGTLSKKMLPSLYKALSERKLALHLVCVVQALPPDTRDLAGPMRCWLSTVDAKNATAKYSCAVPHGKRS